MQNEIVSTYSLPAVIAIIMFNLGLSLTLSDFKKVFTFPKALIIGLICQMLILPAIAFLIVSFLSIRPEYKVGIILISACPGGATSNLITYLLKGNVALSISLTSINSLLILFTIPGITLIALNAYMGHFSNVHLPVLQTILKIFVMIIIPAALGLLFRHKQPVKAKKTEKILKKLTIVLLAVVYSVAIFTNSEGSKNPVSAYLTVAPYVFILNLVGMFTGFLAGKAFKVSKDVLITLPIEVGIQNSALAITIATSAAFLANSAIAVPAVVYGMFTFFNALIFGYLIKKWATPRV